MASLKSEHRRPTRLSSIIPDLTDKIIRLDSQYCSAGGFGDVYRCRYTSNDGVKEVAVKAFRFGFSVDESKDGGKSARMIRRELGIWRRLSHPNIVPFLGIVYGFGLQGNASLVSMWMPHGTLHTFLEAHDDRLVTAYRLRLLLDIANGLDYLHSFPMVHGDLSSSNVLVDHSYNACLTDFGCASLVGELPEGLTYLKMTNVRPGNLRWAAPEHFSLDEQETKHTTKSDIYSLGHVALLVLSGKYPWSEIQSDAAVVRRLFQGLKPGRPLDRPIDDKHWALIEQCWSSVPERPLAKDVVPSLEQFLRAVQVSDTIGLAAVLSQNRSVAGGITVDVPPRTVSPGKTCNEFRRGKISPLSRQLSNHSEPESPFEEDDELSTLGGKTRLVSKKDSLSPQSSPAVVDRSPTPSNPVVPLPLASGSNHLHPTVVEYLKTFGSTPIRERYETSGYNDSPAQIQPMELVPGQFPNYFPVYDYGMVSRRESPETNTMQKTWQDFVNSSGLSLSRNE